MLIGVIKFSNGQKQEEKNGFQRVDLYNDTTKYFFEENHFEVSYFTQNPVAGNYVAKLKTKCDNATEEAREGDCEPISQDSSVLLQVGEDMSKNCTDERKLEMIDYWVPKRGEEFREYILSSARCVDSSSIYL